jgi:hypothetical protein
MRRILVVIAVTGALASIASPATAASSKQATAYQSSGSSSTSIVVSNYTDLELHWLPGDGTHVYETDFPLSYYGGTFSSDGLRWIAVSWTDAAAERCDPQDNCTTGELVASLRWDSYGHRHRTLNPDGTVYAYWRKATLSESLTWEGESMVDWSSSITARVLRYVSGP